uniref:uncharacterized protein LOC122582390 n=1 Tax=Erigeron canadensis TaxID=72917 RepID=UPI001CB98DCD|nr:uncharacterized protein LOC122582390 [Erigeron canadensis]
MGPNTGSSQALLDIENNTHNSESALLVCKSGDDRLLKKLEAAKAKASSLPLTKPTISAPPPSQVMGKLKDFLGVMAESNKKLLQNPLNYDIEALTGDESEYIEMDLMLGVADLNTPGAVAAAELALAGSQPVISLDASSSDSDSEDSSEDDNDDSCNDLEDDTNGEINTGTCSPLKSKSQTLNEKPTNAVPDKSQKRKRSKIVELS